ncbi:MAG: hypothetical protein MZW92_23080 [Comamonadaceae bacterium]|nr:hypothetical protein [Comamonadaceae bacterium]
MIAGTEKAYTLAKKYKLKTAWSTDTLFDAKLATRQGAQTSSSSTRWYTPAADAASMATADNARAAGAVRPAQPLSRQARRRRARRARRSAAGRRRPAGQHRPDRATRQGTSSSS